VCVRIENIQKSMQKICSCCYTEDQDKQ